MEYIETTLSLIHPSPTNPRKSFPAEEMAEMTDSVKRHGILQPILVRPWPPSYSAGDGNFPAYELVAGERRYRAAKAAELESIPVMVRNLTDHEVLEIQIIENLQRKGLHPIEEAESYALMINDHGYTADQLAEKIGKSRAYIYGRMKLTALCMPARLAFRDGKLTPSTALLIARIPGEEMQKEALHDITETWNGVLSYREAATVIQRDYCFYLDKAPFPQENLMLAPTAGACSTCPRRSGANPDLYPDIKRADVCTDPACYKAKTSAWTAYQAAQAKDAGKTVVVGDAAEKLDIDFGNKFVKLDATNYQANIPGKGYVTYRETLELIGEKAPETIMVESQRQGALVEAVEMKQLKQAMEAAGITVANTSAETDRENEKKARVENEFRRRLFLATHDTIKEQLATDETPDLETEELCLVARQFWSTLWSEAQGAVAFYWTHEGDEKESHSRRHAMLHRVTERLPGMSRQELCLFLLDCALIGQTKVDAYRLDKECHDLLGRARACGIDPADIRQAMESEKAAKRPKSKTAKTTSTPSKAPPGGEPERAEKLPIRPYELEVGDRVQIKPDSDLVNAGKLGIFRGYNDAGEAIVWLDGVPASFLCYPDELDPVPITEGDNRFLVVVDGTPAIGSRVRVKDDAKGSSGQRRKCCGREGVVEATFQGGARFAVRFGEKKDVVADLRREELDLLAEAEPTSTPQKAALAAVMYAHPDHPYLCWSGRGKKPKWVEIWLATEGNTLEMLSTDGGKDLSSAPVGANAKPCAAELPARCSKTLELPLA